MKYCKLEYYGAVVYSVNVSLLLLFISTLAVFFFPNIFNLPIKFYIIILPFDGFSLNWAINYIYQVVQTFLALTLFIGYLLTTLLLMRHSCWKIDIALIYVKRLKKKLEEQAARDTIDHLLGNVVKIVDDVITWHNNLQDIMKISFLAEFSLLSSIFCLCIFTLMTSPKSSIYALILTMAGLSQLFVYCFFGSQVESGYDNLSAEIYDLDWYNLTPKQRKDLLKVLCITQAKTGFHGFFQPVNLPTFEAVSRKINKKYSQFYIWQIVKLSYSLITFLQATT